jgi:hypothetical protein
MLVEVVYRGGTHVMNIVGGVNELLAVFSATFPDAISPKLIHKGVQLHRDGSLPSSGSKPLRVMVVAATVEETAAIIAAKPARLRDDLDGTAKPSTSKPRSSKGGIHGLSGEYGFGTIETLPGLPDSGDVRAILQRLADDAGIRAVMIAHRWHVPVLGEMYPEGRVGTDPVCVLGYNVNRGQRINLRVRTDDMAGFRKFETMKQVLWHELAHNDISEHTGEFFNLVSALTREGNAADWRRTSGLMLSHSQTVFRRDIEVGNLTEVDVGHVLGGNPTAVSCEPIFDESGMSISRHNSSRERAAAAASLRASATLPIATGSLVHSCDIASEISAPATLRSDCGELIGHVRLVDVVESEVPNSIDSITAGNQGNLDVIDASHDESMLGGNTSVSVVPILSVGDGASRGPGDPDAATSSHRVSSLSDNSSAIEEPDVELDPTAPRRKRLLTGIDRLVSDCLAAAVPSDIAVHTIADVIMRAFDVAVGRSRTEKHRSIRLTNSTLIARTAGSGAVKELLLAAGFVAVASELGDWLAVPEGSHADIASLWLARELLQQAALELVPSSSGCTG